MVSLVYFILLILIALFTDTIAPNYPFFSFPGMMIFLTVLSYSLRDALDPRQRLFAVDSAFGQIGRLIFDYYNSGAAA